MNCYNKNYFLNEGKTMKLYRIGIMLLMLMGTCLQADVTTKEPVCKNTVECDNLIHAIEVQIDELKAKGTLTKDEKRLRFKLNKQLLATQDATILVQKAKTARQREIIAEEKAKTQAAFEKVSEKLNAIESSLK